MRNWNLNNQLKVTELINTQKNLNSCPVCLLPMFFLFHPPKHTGEACSVSFTAIQNMEFLVWETVGTKCCFQSYDSILKSIFRFALSVWVVCFFFFSKTCSLLGLCRILFKSTIYTTQVLKSIFIFLGKQKVSSNMLIKG